MVALLCSAPHVAHAQPSADSTHLLRLEMLLEAARSANAQLEAARLSAEADRAAVPQAEALPQPMAGVTVQPWPIHTARGTQRSQWRVEQQIPFPGKRELRGQVAELRAEVSRWEANALAEQVERQVRSIYYALYRLQEQTELVRRFQERLTDFESAAATRYEVGEGPQQAILRLQVAENRLDQQLADLAGTRATYLARLYPLTGLPASALEGALVAPPPEIRAAPIDSAWVQRSAARSARARLEQAERAVELARRAFLPDFSIHLTYFDIAESDVPPSSDGRDALGIGLGVKVPLWRAPLESRLEEAQLRAAAARARNEDLRRSIAMELDAAESRLDAQQEQLTRYVDVLIPQAEATLEATRSAYGTGRSSYLDLLDAERALFELQMAYETTLASFLQTLADFDYAAGRFAPRP